MLFLVRAAGVAGAGEDDDPHDGEEFQGPESCAPCHPRHYLEWRGSAHAYAAVDPLVDACNRRALAETGGRIGAFCAGCHSPVGVRSGELRDDIDLRKASAKARQGVTCEVCHRMERPDEGAPLANASFRLGEPGTFFGNLLDPQATPAHQVAESKFLSRSEHCGSCHDVIHNGALIEKSFAQWSGSLYSERADQCQDCHMLRYSGQAAVDGPFRETLRRHNFPAVTIPLVPFPNRGYQKDQVEEFIRTAARMEVLAPASVESGSDLHLTVRVKNSGAGHNLPTGLSNERQMWIEVTVVEKGGSVIFRSGHLDGRGDLQDAHGENPSSDPFLVTFSDRFLDERGAEVPFIFMASSVDERSLKPLEERNAAYRVPVALPPGASLEARVRLLFRPFPPYALRDLGVEHLAAELPIWEMDGFESSPIAVVEKLPRRTEHSVPGDLASIQSAIDALRDGDTILAGPGEHVFEASLDFRGKSIHVRAAAGPERTTLRLAPGRAGSVVVFRGGEERGAVLEGFTISGGSGTQIGARRMGGGILVARSSPTIRGNSIEGCEAPGGVGGGICIDGGAPAVTGNRIRDCGAEEGGGIALRASPSGAPGEDSDLQPVLSGNRIEGNRARLGGGVHVERDSGALIERTVFSGNVAAEDGGAIHAGNGASLRLDRVTIAQNRAARGADIGGSGAARALGTSCVLWKNEPAGALEGLEHSIIDVDAIHGSTNLKAYPLFRDPGGWFRPRSGDAARPADIGDAGVWSPGDYSLLLGSPAVDRGDPGAAADPDDTRADAGAFFFEQPLRAFVRGDVDGDGAVLPSDIALACASLFDGAVLRCSDAADLDDDGVPDPADAAWLAALALRAAADPEPPFRSCGTDPTFGDGLDCNLKADPCLGHEPAAR